MHPTLSRYLARLAGLSYAKTSKGVLAFVRKHPDCLKAIPSRQTTWTVEQWNFVSDYHKWESEPVKNFELEERATQIAVNDPAHARKSNWYTAQPRVHYVSLGSVCTESFRYKGKFSGYSGSNYFPEYNSYFRVARNSGGVCEYYADNSLSRRRLAPKGMRFEKDSLGVKVVDIASGVDYHFSLVEFQLKKFVTYIRERIAFRKRAQALMLKESRKTTMVEEILRNPKKLAKIWVTRDDSLESGNCQAGTDRFIETAFRDSSGIGAARADWLIEKWPSPAVVSAVRRALLRSV